MSEAYSDAFDLKDLYEEDIDPDPESGVDRAKRFLEMNVIAPARIAADDWHALVGGVTLASFVLMDIIGVWLVERPTNGDAPVLAAPFESLAYPLDTDMFGQPIRVQLIHATPGMFKMILAGTAVSVGFTTLVGVVVDFEYGTYIDLFLTTVTDMVITIPGLSLIIIIMAIPQPENPYITGVFPGIDNWSGLARTTRSQVLSTREESYVEASGIMGIPLSSTLRRDILSQLMPYVMINGALTSRRIILEPVGLYLLSILSFTMFNWGVVMNLVYESSVFIRLGMLPRMVAPMVCIPLLSFGLVLLSRGLDSLLNVRLRACHANTSKKGTSKNNQSQATGGGWPRANTYNQTMTTN